MNCLKRFGAMLCSILILTALVVPASAAEGTLDCTYVDITGDGFVADTFNGVNSLYNQSGPTLYCVELIVRYYKEVYGLDIRCNGGVPTVLNSTDLYFEPTATPRPGDVMYGSAAARSKGYNHWSLVKEFSGDAITCFEQNWRWNGQAGIDRIIAYPTSYYEIYTLVSRSGAQIEMLNNPATPVSSWAQSYIERAEVTGIAALSGDYQANVTRSEFCQMALNVLENYGVQIPPAASVCDRAMLAGLISSASEDRAVTREEAAVITSRLVSIIGRLPACDSAAVLGSYTDANAISLWAQDAVAQVTACGLMAGNSGSFRPQEVLSNEQAVALMVRVDENPTPAVAYNAPHDEAGDNAVTALTMRTLPAADTDCAAQDVVLLGAQAINALQKNRQVMR